MTEGPTEDPADGGLDDAEVDGIEPVEPLLTPVGARGLAASPQPGVGMRPGPVMISSLSPSSA